MALSAERAGTRVALVPVGLNFERKTIFRSRVIVVYGPPFFCRDLIPASDAEYVAAARALTERIAEHMRRLLIEADPQADARLVERVDRLYTAARDNSRSPGDRVQRRRAIASGIERLRSADPERYNDVLLRLRRYDQRLNRFGLRDRHLDWQPSTSQAVRFGTRELLFGLILLPLCIAGFALFVVPYTLTGFAARRAATGTDVLATAQVVAGAVIYGAWLLLVGTVAARLGGAGAAVAAVLLAPAAAIAALFAIERESAVLDAVRAWFFLRRARHETRERLQRRRTELADVLDQVHEWLLRNEAAPQTDQ
jgi:hypothetical protein